VLGLRAGALIPAAAILRGLATRKSFSF
jgi:hypothetical protein